MRRMKRKFPYKLGRKQPPTVGCEDCGRPYGDAHGFPDLVIPNEIWRQISPSGDEGGLLCPSCICKRLYDKGISNVSGSFMSGPIRSVDEVTMHALRMAENATEKALRMEEKFQEVVCGRVSSGSSS